MAVTYITRIYSTINLSIDYIIRDKVVYTGESLKELLSQEALRAAGDYLENAIDYIGRDKTLSNDEVKAEIRKTLTSTINCTYDNAKHQFKVTREKYNNGNVNKQGVGKEQREILGYHVWQSFEEKIDSALSNEIGVKLAQELYGDYQCIVSTHNNTAHTHNHIVFNSISSKNGKKFNICTTNTRKLREVSDRLCEEYGLSVLQSTKDMNLQWYKDNNGEWKCFEVTERNREVKKGTYSKTTDYRNYEAYQKNNEFKESNCKIIRRDIDRFIPLSTSLDELIGYLQDIGYEIKNLNSNGGFLQYISFKAPGQDKFTRGNLKTLGEEYTREGIINRISENQKKKNRDETISDENIKKSVENNSKLIYQYGEIDIESIDEKYVKKYNKNKKTWVLVPRSDVEKYIIVDTKILNQNLETIYKQANTEPVFGKKNYKGKNASVQYCVNRINENLKALSFIEEKNLQSFEQINMIVQSLYEKRNEVNVEFAKIKELLMVMNRDIVLMRQYNNLKNSIESNKTDNEYLTYEMQGETALLKQYEEMLKAKKLLMPAEQAERLSKYDKFVGRFEQLAAAYKNINDMISEYDKTVYVINRIDRDYDRRYRRDIKEYYDIRNENRQNTSYKDK